MERGGTSAPVEGRRRLFFARENESRDKTSGRKLPVTAAAAARNLPPECFRCSCSCYYLFLFIFSSSSFFISSRFIAHIPFAAELHIIGRKARNIARTFAAP